VLFFVVHHSAFDGWSRSLLIGELSALYQAFREGLPFPLPPLAVQYQDFARWQRRTVVGEALERQVNFWREHLRGARSLDLSAGRPKPLQPAFRGDSEAIAVPQDLQEDLEAFAARHSVTLFMTLFAAFNVLLYLETGEDDIVVISLFANRDQIEIENLIGNFFAGLPLRSRFSGACTFLELLAQVRDVTLAAHEHPDILYERVFEGMEFQDKEDQGGLSTFRVLFQLANLPSPEADGSALKVTRLPFDTGAMSKDLSLFLFQSSGQISGRLRYNLDVLDRERAARMCDRFLQILAAALANPDCPLAELLPETAQLTYRS
jgi:hypothetical protein